MNEVEINRFWNANPCGEALIAPRMSDGHRTFFDAYDAFRYKKEAHILEELDAISFDGKEVLEIGLGLGADSEQIIRRGGRWNGLDLTQESVDRVRLRMGLRELDHGEIHQGSILNAPFEDDRFDIVFSHGVLHHVPDILQAQREIKRILRPDGVLIVMLYAKWSLNYLVAISVARRIGLGFCYAIDWAPSEKIREHIENAKKTGLFDYLRMENFIHRNTDGPGNPYSKVYDDQTIRADFPEFDLIQSHKRWNYAPPLPSAFLPGDRLMGWHLWARLAPRRA